MPFEISIHDLAEAELAQIRAFDRNRILDEIEAQLTHEPTKPTWRRKPLDSLTPSFEHSPPVWELRVGEFRVFYDVDSDANLVHVRSVRRKPPDRTTEQIT